MKKCVISIVDKGDGILDSSTSEKLELEYSIKVKISLRGRWYNQKLIFKEVFRIL